MTTDTHYELTLPSSGITTRIALLSLLSLRPMHGYELRQMMEARHMDRWANIQYGSIYRGLQQLAREGLLAEHGEERDGNRPPRTIYRITPQGEDELKSLLRKAWAEPSLFADPVDLALRLVSVLPPAEVDELIQKRLQVLDDMLAHFRQGDAEFEQHFHDRPAGIRAVIADLFAHRRILLEAERGWIVHIRARLLAGAYQLSDADLEHLRQHLTHHPPATSADKTTPLT